MKAPSGTAYFTGRVHEVPEDKAKEYIQAGYARHTTPVLPEDIPHREDLLKADLLTIDKIKSVEDLTEVAGIGKAGAKKINEYLAEC